MTIKNLSQYDLHESLNCLYDVKYRMQNDYLHIKECIQDELDAIDKKIDLFEKELRKRYK